MYRFSIPLYLASKSPRRHELLKRFRIAYHPVRAAVREPRAPARLGPAAAVRFSAKAKALQAAKRVRRGIVLGFDTVVFHRNRILGKPANGREALAMLRSLSGATHRVYTGMAAVVKPGGRVRTAHAATRVTFRKLEDIEIKSYIKSKEPFDKAGAYGIQGLGGAFVSRIQGCFFNVVGLPVAQFLDFLKPYRA
jgi:septum formation protein